MLGRGVKAAALTGLLAAAALLTACGSDSSGGGDAAGSGLQKVIVGYIPIGDESLIKVADQQGIFKAHGLQIEYGKPAATGAGQVSQVLNGQLNVGLGSFTGVISAVSQGIPVQIVSALNHDYETDGQNASATLVAPGSTIKSFGDLEGRTVAVNSLQGNWEIGIREAVAADGGDPSKVNVTAIPFAEMNAALKEGRVDAVTQTQPFSNDLITQGCTNLGNTQAVALHDPEGEIVAAFMSQSFIESNPKAAQGWVDAIAEASKFANDHPDVVRKVITGETGLPADLINKAPIPAFTAAVKDSTIERWGALLEKNGIIKSAPQVDKVLWNKTPRG